MATVNRLHTKKTERPMRVGGILAKFAQWATIKHEVTSLTTRQNHLRDEIADFVTENGWKDDNGSYFYDLPQPVQVGEQTFEQIKRERRVSTFFKEDEAEEWLTANGLLEEAQTTVVTLDQDKVYVLNQEGKIPDDVIDSFFGQKETFAFKPIAN